MEIRRLDTTRSADRRAFIHFPFELYRSSAVWVPPFVSDMHDALDPRKNPYFRHSDGAFFLAVEGRQTLGRIAVYHNNHYNDYYDTTAALFYYFECIEDPQVASALFSAAFEYARGRGLTRIIGPRGSMPADGIGLLVDGFQHQPAMGIPYNWPYYDAYVKANGFRQREDLMSGYLPTTYEFDPRMWEIAERVKARRGFRVLPLETKAQAKKWIGRLGDMLNRALFPALLDSYPYTPEEIALAGEQILAVADPRLVKLVLKGDEVVGFLFAFPNLSAALRKARGRLWPFGWYYLLREYKRTEWLDINSMGLLPEHRGVGAMAVLYTELAKTIKQYGFKHCDIVQVSVINQKSMAEMESFGVQWYKTHRVYEREI